MDNKLKVRDRFVQSPLATAKVTGVAATLRARLKRAVEVMAQLDRVALFDGSGSMSACDAVGLDGLPCTRWQALGQAWCKLSPLCEGRLAAYVFSSGVHPVKGSASGDVVALPYGGGDTPMCDAFRRVANHHRHPSLRVLVVGDGLSTDGDPVGVAVCLGCPVDTVYVGPSSGHDAVTGRSQLWRIAEATGGSFRDMAGKFDAGKFLEHITRVFQLED